MVEDGCVRLMVVAEKKRKRGERMKMRENVQLKNQLSPCTLLEITKMSLMASMWHVPFVRSAKMDDKDQFC